MKKTTAALWLFAHAAVVHAAPPTPAGRSSSTAKALHVSSAAAPAWDPGFLEQYAATYRFLLGWPKGIEPVADGSAVLFLRSGPRSFVNDLYEFDSATGKERMLLSAEELLQGAVERLPPEERARRERRRLAAKGIAGFSMSEDGSRILVPLSGRLFVVERSSGPAGTARELRGSPGYPLDPRLSPDGRKLACVRDGDLYVADLDTGREARLTVRTSTAISNGLAEFAAQEEMGRFQGYWWSSDGRAIAYEESDASGLDIMRLADPMRPEIEPQSWPYPRAGGKNAETRLGVIPSGGGKTLWISWDRARYPYLASVRWEENSPLTLLVQNRAQTEEALLLVEFPSGETRRLLVEKDAAWLNLDQSVPRWSSDGKTFLWSTERAGAWQLELRTADGRLVSTLTLPDLGYRKTLDLDDASQAAYVLAGADATRPQVYRIPLDPSQGEPARLTDGTGAADAVFAKGHGVYVMTYANLSGDRSISVRRKDGKLLGQLLSTAQAPPFAPRIVLTKAGELGFRAAMVRPRAFKPGSKYPVIVEVYGGPGVQMVTGSGYRYLLAQWLADHGFIVVSLDGRGTPWRGRQWERAIKGDLSAVPLADQAEGLKALAKLYPELDLSRVGVYGWSFGGYLSAMAALRRPDLFKAAVAGAPVADWRDYDAHYAERYLGLPGEEEKAYDASSLLTYAKDLARPILILHGTMDDNVYFLHGLKLVDALFRAGKPFEFVPMAGFTHMVADPLVMARLYGRIADFLSRELNGAAAKQRR